MGSEGCEKLETITEALYYFIVFNSDYYCGLHSRTQSGLTVWLLYRPPFLLRSVAGGCRHKLSISCWNNLVKQKRSWFPANIWDNCRVKIIPPQTAQPGEGGSAELQR